MTGDLLGSRVLVGVTCLDPNGREVDSFETYGVIESIDQSAIVLRRADLGGVFGLPPSPELLRAAEPGAVYKLQSTGEPVENVDYLATLTVTVADAESLLEIRGIGFLA